MAQQEVNVPKSSKEAVKISNLPTAELQLQHTNSSHLINLSEPDNYSLTTDYSNIFYVCVGLSAVIILCFILRAMRFGTKKTSRIRRYGVKTARGDVEMMPLDNEEDDEDTTVFDVTDHSVPQP